MDMSDNTPTMSDTTTPAVATSAIVRLSRCCICDFEWPTGTHGRHSCAGILELKLHRVTWLLGQIIADLPANRDWLNPEIEREARTFLPNTKINDD
jgi:hypothetical protein